MLSSEEKLKVYRTALYLRLSKDDGDKAESESIGNQRLLIQDYIRGRKEFCVVDEYVDDGYSGSNFERPAFKRMCIDLENGAINCVIVKDLSRFGRNYIDVGRYLEQIFPSWGVRLIAINDNYDGACEWSSNDSIIVPIKNIINDSYCRDLSIKIKSQLEAKRKRGDFVGNFTVYGYKKDPENHSRLVIDDAAADIVRQIYAWKLDGMSNQGIANRLNDMGVLSPLEYKRKHGQKISDHFKQNNQARWSSKAITRILHDEIYIGNMVQGKRKKTDYRSSNMTEVPERKWIRVTGTHEAIIDPGHFEIIQELNEKDTRIAPGKDKVTLFSGFIECGDCHNSMVRHAVSQGDKQYYYYICNTYKTDRSCPGHNISHKKVYATVLHAVQMQISLAVRMEKLLSEAEHLPVRKNRIVQLEIQKVELQEEMAGLERLRQKLYDDFYKGVLEKKDYLEYAEMYGKKIVEKQDALEEVARQREIAIGKQTDNSWIAVLKKYENITELTRPLLLELVKKVLIYEDGRIEIVFRHQDEAAELLQCIQNPVQEENVKVV